MFTILLWLYLFNAVLLINHEIDSAYWKEWNLFKIPGGIASFLVIHLFLVFIILSGIILIHQQTSGGLFISALVSLGGIFAFSIHTYFIKKGHPEFNTTISQMILIALLIISIVQLGLTAYLMIA
jgi:hypothetical protein